MSPVESCRGCGGLFAFLPRGYCADCLDLRERRYQDVREWLLDNRGASVPQVSAATGVEEGLIMAFIREGRLEFISDVAVAEDEELKERIRRDLAARAATAPDRAEATAPRPTGGRRPGMRTRTS